MPSAHPAPSSNLWRRARTAGVQAARTKSGSRRRTISPTFSILWISDPDHSRCLLSRPRSSHRSKSGRTSVLRHERFRQRHLSGEKGRRRHRISAVTVATAGPTRRPPSTPPRAAYPRCPLCQSSFSRCRRGCRFRSPGSTRRLHPTTRHRLFSRMRRENSRRPSRSSGC